MDRKDWMGILAKAEPDALVRLWAATGLAPAFEWLRRPEIGTAMVRGRMGAVGDAFNLGEVTVTRCALRLKDGVDGHAYVKGRSARHAELAALCDALLHGDQAGQVFDAIIAPLQEAARLRAATVAAKAKSSKVDFFTMVRGED